jgi:hypothetical protein
LNQVLPLLNDSFVLYLDDRMAQEATQFQYTVTIPSSSVTPLKVTLAWYDPPCSQFASKVLLHDLDLVLTDPSGRTYFGNTLSTSVPVSSTHLSHSLSLSLSPPCVVRVLITLSLTLVIFLIPMNKLDLNLSSPSFFFSFHSSSLLVRS